MSLSTVPSLSPLASPALAQAGNNMEKAKTHFNAGMDYYREKKYELALAEFQESYRLFPIIDMQYNMALCHEKLGRLDEAITAYKLFAEAKPDEKEKREAEERIAWIEADLLAHKRRKEKEAAEQAPPARPGEVKTQPDPMKQEEADSQAAVPSQPAVAKPSSPPPVQDNYESQDQSAGTTIDIGKRPDRPSRPYRNLMWASFGLSAAGAAAGVFGYLGAKAQQDEHAGEADRLAARGKIIEGPDGGRDFRDQKTADRFQPSLNEKKAAINTYRTVEVAGFGAGALFLVLGGTFYWLDAERVRVSAAPLPGGGRAGLEWNW